MRSAIQNTWYAVTLFRNPETQRGHADAVGSCNIPAATPVPRSLIDRGRGDALGKHVLSGRGGPGVTAGRTLPMTRLAAAVEWGHERGVHR